MKYSRLAPAAAMLLLVLSGVAGCDRGSDADVASPEVDACALLASAELQDVLGAQVGAGEPGVPADALMDGAPAVDCRWATPDNTRTLTLALRRAMSVEDAQAAIEPVRESFQSGGFSPTAVDGLADDAFFAFNQLHVRAGVDYLTISITGLSNADALEAARTAADLSLRRLSSGNTM